MGGAAILMVITRSDVEKTLEEVEWTTLFFFMGLFIVVNGAIEVGFIDKLSSGVLNIMGDSPYNAALIVLWGSAICAGVMNNVSFTAAALPIVKNIIDTMGYEGTPMAASFWWALALGACLGGNLTPVGAAANVLTMDFAERNGHPVSFGKFMKWSIPITIISLIVATGWVSFLIWRAS
jgi:Na+/H+ antiporter NhaD/arsenite permease-like protein